MEIFELVENRRREHKLKKKKTVLLKYYGVDDFSFQI